MDYLFLLSSAIILSTQLLTSLLKILVLHCHTSMGLMRETWCIIEGVYYDVKRTSIAQVFWRLAGFLIGTDFSPRSIASSRCPVGTSGTSSAQPGGWQCVASMPRTEPTPWSLWWSWKTQAQHCRAWAKSVWKHYARHTFPKAFPSAE
jgi:hypothetical protein